VVHRIFGHVGLPNKTYEPEQEYRRSADRIIDTKIDPASPIPLEKKKNMQINAGELLSVPIERDGEWPLVREPALALGATASNLLPSLPGAPCEACQRSTATSTYSGSSSIAWQAVRSDALHRWYLLINPPGSLPLSGGNHVNITDPSTL
jgi:hypothetical protein